MAPKLYLHIGQPKTASTALQKALARHPSALADAGVVYPVTDGNDDHEGEVADLLIQSIAPTASNQAGYARLKRHTVPGSWNQLVQRVVSAPADVIVSHETLSASPARIANQVVSELTEGVPNRAKVVLAVRPLSELLASAYAQLAQDTLLPGFELWARTWLGARVRRPELDTTFNWTDGFQVAKAWQTTGADVECVQYQSDSGRYWREMLTALGLAEVQDQITLPRANPSMSALGLAAWQQHLRSGVDPHNPATKRLRKSVRAGIAEVSDVTLGGRYSFTSDMKELLDAAFPQPPAGAFTEDVDTGNRRSPQARESFERLEERLRDGHPLTTQPLVDRAHEVAALAARIAEYDELASTR